MGKRLPEQELKLYKSIDDILWEKWDPIGIQGIKEARDEYYECIPKVFELAKLNKKQEISDYLIGIETEHMGLHGNRESCNNIARLVLEAKYKFLK